MRYKELWNIMAVEIMVDFRQQIQSLEKDFELSSILRICFDHCIRCLIHHNRPMRENNIVTQVFQSWEHSSTIIRRKKIKFCSISWRRTIKTSRWGAQKLSNATLISVKRLSEGYS